MSRPILVLDSTVFRYVGDDRLRQLRRAGFDLRVSIFSFVESWATALRAQAKPKSGEDAKSALERFSRAVRRLQRHSREETPIEFSLEVYLREYGAQMPPHLHERSAAAIRADFADAWRVASTDPLDEHALEQGRELIASGDAVRENWKRFARACAVRLEDADAAGDAKLANQLMAVQRSDPASRVDALQVVIAEALLNSGAPRSFVEGLDAFTRMMAWQAMQGFAGAETVGAHDGADAHQLAHLATGATLVTRDQNFIDQVDLTRTHLAPWVCTDEQILNAAPRGLPTGSDVRERALEFRRWPTPPTTPRGIER